MTAAVRPAAAGPFAHEGLFYRGSAEYLAGMLPFIATGLAAGEPVAVAVPGTNLALIRDALGEDARHVRFRDMNVVGRNPGRIIPLVLLAFVAEHPGRRVRIIGEPIWAGRTETEYPACVQHEALINVALAGRAATILCPYDACGLSPVVLADAEGTHPVLVSGERRDPSPDYRDPADIVAAYNAPLPGPPAAHATLTFGYGSLAAVRAFVATEARRAGLSADRIIDAELAVSELAANAIEHGGGGGTVIAWAEDGSFCFEVTDSGQLRDPLAGRRSAPNGESARGRGLLLVQALCDLVRVHAHPDSTTTRLYLHTG